jgi:hypothetical protein
MGKCVSLLLVLFSLIASCLAPLFSLATTVKAQQPIPPLPDPDEELPPLPEEWRELLKDADRHQASPSCFHALFAFVKYKFGIWNFSPD